MYGGLGVGKTYLAACICNELVEHGYHCCFTSLREVQDTWGNDHNRELTHAIHRLGCHDLVVLDDYLRERNTSWMQELSFRVADMLDTRRVPTVVTTNAPVEFLAKPPAEVAAALDRIKHRAKVVEVKGANMRQVLGGWR